MAEHQTQFGMIPLQCIQISPNQPRKTFDPEKLQELADNLAEYGVLQPVLLRPVMGSDTMLELVAGERRYRASIMAKLPEIPGLVKDLTDQQVASIQLIENLQRDGVHPLEEAAGIQRLVDEFEMSIDQICKELSITRAYAYGRLKLLDLTEAARPAFISGKLSASTALLIARIPVPALQVKATTEIVHNYGQPEPMSHRAAVQMIQNRYMLRLQTAEFSPEDAKLIPAAGSCSKCPKLTTNQRELFADVDADVCTDPDCFGAKKAALHQRMLTLAKKKKLPVYDGIQAYNEQSDDETLVAGYSRAGDFERFEDTGKRYQSIASLLSADELPEPKAVIKLDNGKTAGVYERTAIQDALEKAGLALTLERHNQLIQDKLHSRDGESDNETIPEPKIDPRVAIAEKESAYHAALYAKVYDSLNADSLAPVYRALLKYFLTCIDNYVDWGLSYARQQHYGFDISDKDAVAAYVAKASDVRVQQLYFDIYLYDTQFIAVHEIEDGKFVEDEGDLTTDARATLLEIAAWFSIDVDALRVEHFPPAEPASEVEPADPTEPEPAKPKGKGKKAAPVPKTVKNPAAAWPFPTGDNK